MATEDTAPEEVNKVKEQEVAVKEGVQVVTEERIVVKENTAPLEKL